MLEKSSKRRTTETVSWNEWIKRRDLLVDWVLGVDHNVVLNPIPGEQIIDVPARRLKLAANAMRASAMHADGTVDYGLMADSEAYQEFQLVSRALHHFAVGELKDRAHQIAFWINIYNAMIIDGIIQFRIKKSMLEDLGFFRRAAYQIGGLRFSADDIEHGILRGNRKAPSLPFPQFASDDPRLALSVRSPDPRIHFVLVCGANSCPPIAFYDGEHLDWQLDAAARTFINQGGVVVDESNSTLKLSQIFKWYRPDFEPAGGVVAFVSKHLEDDLGDLLRSREGWRLSYLPYDWSLNGVLG